MASRKPIHATVMYLDPKVVAERAEMASKLYVAFNLFSIATLACIKISAVLFYRRIFCIHGCRSFFNTFRVLTIIIIITWMVGYMMLTGLSCGTHFSALWGSQKAFSKYCQTQHKFLLSFSISDFLLDLWILGLPMPKIWALHSTVRRKIAVTGAFLLAFAGLGACITRMVIYIQIIIGTISILDPELLNTEPIYYTTLECGLSLIAVNLPSLWYLFSNTVPDYILQSVRSIMSLRSEPSAGHGSTQPSQLKGRSNSSSSRSHILATDTPHIETHALRDLDDSGQRSDLSNGKIHVREQMSHTATHV